MALPGSHLRVAAKAGTPWVEFERDQLGNIIESSGIVIDIVNIIANRLNFTYTFVEAADGEWGRILPNGSVTGLIGMCHRNEADMALGPFELTYSRSQVMDYSDYLFIDKQGLMLPRPQIERELVGFMKPFRWQVWIVLFSVLLGSMVPGCVMDWLVRKWVESPQWLGPRNANGGPLVTFRPMWPLQLLCSETLYTLPVMQSGRVFIGMWMVVAFIVSSAYQGTLISLLTVPKVEIPVRSLQDLVDYGKIPWAVEYGTSLHQVFADADSGLYKAINDGAILIGYSYNERERIKREKLAIITDGISRRMIMSDDFSETGECNYYIPRDSGAYAMLVFAFPKRSVLTHHFNKWIGRMMDAALIERLINVFVPNATNCLVTPGEEPRPNNAIFSLQDLAGIFLLYIGGVAASSLIFLIETISKI